MLRPTGCRAGVRRRRPPLQDRTANPARAFPNRRRAGTAPRVLPLHRRRSRRTAPTTLPAVAPPAPFRCRGTRGIRGPDPNRSVGCRSPGRPDTAPARPRAALAAVGAEAGADPRLETTVRRAWKPPGTRASEPNRTGDDVLETARLSGPGDGDEKTPRGQGAATCFPIHGPISPNRGRAPWRSPLGCRMRTFRITLDRNSSVVVTVARNAVGCKG
jgi:hypothetical protein